MWFKSDDFKEIASLLTNEDILSSVVPDSVLESDDSDLEIDELRKETPEAICREKCLILARKWRNLDEDYLNKTSEPYTRPNMTSIHLNLPKGFSTLADLDENFEKRELSIRTKALQERGEHGREEYLKRLKKIFKEMPLLEDVVDSSLKTTLQTGRIKGLHQQSMGFDELEGPSVWNPESLSHTSAQSPGVPSNQCIITVAIVEPGTETMVQELALLETNTLLDLRNCLFCPQDRQVCVIPGSSLPPSEPKPSVKDAYFFIEGTFYADAENLHGVGHEDAGNDTSLKSVLGPLPEWLKAEQDRWQAQSAAATATAAVTSANAPAGSTGKRKQKRRRPGSCSSHGNPFAAAFGLAPGAIPGVKSMRYTAIKDVKFRMGVRYLLTHCLGRCQHWLYFTGAHVHHPAADPSSKAAYPQRLTQRLPLLIHCEICSVLPAVWVTYYDRLAPPRAAHAPTYFCRECYHMLHYDEEDKLLYDDFAVFPYAG